MDDTTQSNSEHRFSRRRATTAGTELAVSGIAGCTDSSGSTEVELTSGSTNGRTTGDGLVERLFGVTQVEDRALGRIGVVAHGE